jgi:hypothetical protein
MRLAVMVYGGLLICVAALMVAGEAIGPNFRESYSILLGRTFEGIVTAFIGFLSSYAFRDGA